jgi:uncharacterized membrane protein
MSFFMWTTAAAVKVHIAESIVYGLFVMAFGIAIAAREPGPEGILLLLASLFAAVVGWIAVGPWVIGVADRLGRNLEVRLDPKDHHFLLIYIPLTVLLPAEVIVSILGHVPDRFVYSIPFLSAGAYVAASKVRIAVEFRKTEQKLNRRILVEFTNSGPYHLVFRAESQSVR